MKISVCHFLIETAQYGLFEGQCDREQSATRHGTNSANKILRLSDKAEASIFSCSKSNFIKFLTTLRHPTRADCMK